jgi:hypothetical protein
VVFTRHVPHVSVIEKSTSASGIRVRSSCVALEMRRPDGALEVSNSRFVDPARDLVGMEELRQRGECESSRNRQRSIAGGAGRLDESRPPELRAEHARPKYQTEGFDSLANKLPAQHRPLPQAGVATGSMAAVLSHNPHHC